MCLLTVTKNSYTHSTPTSSSLRHSTPYHLPPFLTPPLHSLLPTLSYMQTCLSYCVFSVWKPPTCAGCEEKNKTLHFLLFCSVFLCIAVSVEYFHLYLFLSLSAYVLYRYALKVWEISLRLLWCKSNSKPHLNLCWTSLKFKRNSTPISSCWTWCPSESLMEILSSLVTHPTPTLHWDEREGRSCCCTFFGPCQKQIDRMSRSPEHAQTQLWRQLFQEHTLTQSLRSSSPPHSFHYTASPGIISLMFQSSGMMHLRIPRISETKMLSVRNQSWILITDRWENHEMAVVLRNL